MYANEIVVQTKEFSLTTRVMGTINYEGIATRLFFFVSFLLTATAASWLFLPRSIASQLP